MIRAHDVALTRRTAQRHREHAVRLEAITPVRVEISEVLMESGVLSADKKMKEIPFPRECVIASIRCGGQVFIPYGEMVLHTGDELVVAAEEAAREEVLKSCRSQDNNE